MTSNKTLTEAQDKAPSPVVTKQPESPEKLGGPQQVAQTATASALPLPNGAPTPVRGAELLTNGSDGSGAVPRAQTMRSLQRSVGNARASTLLGARIQTKLSVGAADDPQEREADRVAESISQPGSISKSSVSRQIVMKHSLAPAASESPGAQPILRECECGGEAAGGDCPKCSASGNAIQRQASPDGNGGGMDAKMENRITSPSGGQSLPAGIQREMEAGMGADFSNVRVHDSATDQADAGRLNAKAFTHGSDIWLAAGESANDRKLMAHELTHVVQQSGAGSTNQTAQRTASPTLRRFVGTEHAALGDTTGARIDLGDGIVLTWGQVVAIAGDEYGTVEELEAAVSTPGGKARLRAALEEDGVPGAVAAKLPEPSPDQRSEQESEFLVLAMENVTHFPDAGAALGAWAQHHQRAIDAALLAGLANNATGINRAYLFEAFGQHFLTDAFSGGHIRTPRTQIVEWYTVNFAPRVIGPLIANLRTRLIDALVLQAVPQNPRTPVGLIRATIEPRVQEAIDGAITAAGGMAAATRWVGLGVAGAVSGAMHDAEGATGVLVSSDEHPEPWRAFGDQKLADSPVSKQEATKAVAAAKADVDAAYLIGESEAVMRETSNDAPPSRLHFPFNSSALDRPAAQAVQNAAAQLLYHPESKVEIIGHTDPIGLDTVNDALGLRRAAAVRDALVDAGVDPTRVTFRSEGEKLLLTTDPKKFRLNRRAEFSWRSEPDGTDPADPLVLARERVQAKAAAQFVAPYRNVTRFVPRPVEERGGTGNEPLPDWHWGNLTAATRAQVDAWIRTNVGSKLQAAIATNPRLADVTVGDTTVRPREVARAIATQLLANPTARIGDLTGEQPGP